MFGGPEHVPGVHGAVVDGRIHLLGPRSGTRVVPPGSGAGALVHLGIEAERLDAGRRGFAVCCEDERASLPVGPCPGDPFRAPLRRLLPDPGGVQADAGERAGGDDSERPVQRHPPEHRAAGELRAVRQQ